VLNDSKTLTGFTLAALDEDIGKVKEFYFDDKHWTIRYLVAETGNWLTGRQVLISPHAIGSIKTATRRIDIDLTRKQIQDSPSVDTDKPVSREFETDYYSYYNWPVYWGGPCMWGALPYIMRPSEPRDESQQASTEWDHHLRSTNDVTGHHIQSTDGELGHVDGFIIDDETWAIRYLVVDSGNWWPGRKVLVSPRWIDRISWSESKVFVNLTREAIKQSPEFTEGSLLTRDYETELHVHYDREGYWVDEAAAKAYVR
jgi:hypothetical protein